MLEQFLIVFLIVEIFEYFLLKWFLKTAPSRGRTVPVARASLLSLRPLPPPPSNRSAPKTVETPLWGEQQRWRD